MSKKEEGTVTGYESATSVATQHKKLGAFISYSRDDLEFADQLDVALRLWGFDTTIDRHAIAGGEEWKQRLQVLIREADTIVFILSPSSVGSPVCAWEVEEANRLSKRIIPVVCRDLANSQVPPRLQDLNYIFFYKEPKAPDSGFGTGLAKLIEALNTNLEWLREHTRLLLRATEWETGGKPATRLLSGSDISAAKAWATQRPKGAPEPTPLHLEFIRESEEAEDERLHEQRRQLERMATAQQERETALRRAEDALDRTIRLKRRQAWASTITVAIFALVGWWAYGVVQEKLAVAREAAREDIRGQIVAYAAAYGTLENDVAEEALTSPYTTPLVRRLRQKKNLVEAIVDAHQEVLDRTRRAQRPLLSTSMNGQLYLYRQPNTRRKRVLAVSAGDPGADIYRLKAPPHDVDAFIATLIDAGFAQSDITILRNPDKTQIAAAIASIKQNLRQQNSITDKQELLIPARLGFSEEKLYSSIDNTLFIFFFSGHGAHSVDENYLIPRIFNRTIERPEDLANSAVSVSWLMREAEETAAASVLIFDTHFPNLSLGAVR